MTAVAVGLLVLWAVLLVRPSPARRLRRLRVSGEAGDRPAGGPGPPPLWLRRRVSRTSTVEPAQSVAELAALLKAGLPPTQAWQHVASGAQPGRGWDGVITAAAGVASVGGDVAAAIRHATDGCSDQFEVTAGLGLAAAWQVADRTGAPTADVLHRLADSMRSEADARGARGAAMAGPQATSRVLTWLPLGGLAIGQLIGADPVAVLLGTGVGRVCLVLGACLAAAGAVWTRRLVRSATAGQP
ncbi:MAG TPA: type II secretion system F family protein [Actinomycetales bacterium]|nr:type II secretion system F family protein [Actinomycetales bacterium]